MRRAMKLIIGLVVAGSLVFGGPVAADTFRVKTTDNNRWNPDFRHITRGDRIKWINPARFDTVHNVKSYRRNWDFFETLSPGERTSKRFRREGEFRYRCTLHSELNDGVCTGMCGMIHVMN
ncbi:MAG: hypothetical protein M3280_03465 [Actinomycetota bacterium]|nr:hypothetical protein [Actinomycetota bacterium]